MPAKLPELPPVIAQRIEQYPPPVRRRLLQLRKLILQTAASTAGVGTIEETLKWGQPSFLTSETGSGSTIRIDHCPGKTDSEQIALYFICHTNLVEQFRELFDTVFEFQGNRALLLASGNKLPVEELGFCISMALRYHLDKKS